MNVSEKKIRTVVRQAETLSLTLEDGQELCWDANALPLFPANASLRLRLVHPETEAEERSVLAATVLNELLTPTVSPTRP
ncbi:hypothetical protein KBD18_02705 [Patescibacteria group bacterium]|nr:hypothetical protein [Patescibacteria group bacterium]